MNDMGHETRPRHGDARHFDVVIVGAGLSGIGAAYRLQTECPGKTYAILEARESIGGTWDLFRYPGVRSDSDMFTLGYPFKPWHGTKALADGETILSYIRETAAESDIERKIRFSSRVVGADFDTATATWTLTVERRGAEGVSRHTVTCGFLYSCTGYYDYDRGYDPGFPGVEDFAGTIAHPQFWPRDLDHTGKRVIVIGSGATAVTIVPAMAERAAHVTMLQRTPTWIASLPGRDGFADWCRRRLPQRLAHRLVRTKNIAFSTISYQWCRRFPGAARRLLTWRAARALADRRLVADHFTPPYDVWDQRVCAVPDGDLFRAVRSGRVEVVTDHVDRFVPEGIRLKSGRVLDADVIVTATGLRLQAFGGVAPTVDGVEVALPEQFVWRGAMLTGIPNLAICIGYTNASWTLRADLTSRLVCKVLRWMDRHDYAAVVPHPDRELEERPLLDLTSGYIKRSVGDFPRQGPRAPWRVRQNYVLDAATTMRTDLGRSLRPTPRDAVRPPAASLSGEAGNNA
ncbi:flavin-containing monooxygenase [Sphaerimonospora mesophila]|uniref:flavin-containing monooxygenase n=1 Tax=Sphaerimonospora mesophila TaxID=37483 RepID=UPI000AAA9801